MKKTNKKKAIAIARPIESVFITRPKRVVNNNGDTLGEKEIADNILFNPFEYLSDNEEILKFPDKESAKAFLKKAGLTDNQINSLYLVEL